MEHPDNPLLDVALAAIRERSKNGNPIQVEHIAIAVEAVRAEMLTSAAAPSIASRAASKALRDIADEQSARLGPLTWVSVADLYVRADAIEATT